MNLRKADENDRKRIAELIEKDPYHAGNGSADFFFEPDTECLAIEDRGNTFYFRLSRSVRIHAIFDPDKKMANAKMLLKFIPWLAEASKNAGHKEMVFASESPEIIAFEKRQGFVEAPNDMVMHLPTRDSK